MGPGHRPPAHGDQRFVDYKVLTRQKYEIYFDNVRRGTGFDVINILFFMKFSCFRFLNKCLKYIFIYLY